MRAFRGVRETGARPFPASEELLVEGSKGGISPGGGQGGHVEGSSQVDVAGLGEARLAVDGRSGLVSLGAEPGEGYPLRRGQIRCKRGELGEDEDGAERADPLDGEQELVAPQQESVLLDQLESRTQEALVGLLEKLERALEVEPQGLRGRGGDAAGMEPILLGSPLAGDLLKPTAQSA